MSIAHDLYKSMFRKDYEIIWRQFAEQCSGKYEPISSDRVVIPYKNFTLTFDDYTHYTVVSGTAYESEFTRAIVEFTCTENFKFLITQQGFVENISKLFGAQDIRIGDKLFDKKFMVKSNDESNVKELLSNKSITSLMLQNKTLRLTLTNEEGLFSEKPKEGNVMLYYVWDGKIKQVAELHNVLALFTTTLDSLEKMCAIKPA